MSNLPGFMMHWNGKTEKPLHVIVKFIVGYMLTGAAWDVVTEEDKIAGRADIQATKIVEENRAADKEPPRGWLSYKERRGGKVRRYQVKKYYVIELETAKVTPQKQLLKYNQLKSFGVDELIIIPLSELNFFEAENEGDGIFWVGVDDGLKALQSQLEKYIGAML